MKIRCGNKSDIEQIFKLYLATATIKDGLARTVQEISLKYITDFVKNSLKTGLIFVVENEVNQLIAEIHCYKHEPKCFEHTLGNMTLAVHPDFIGQGWGKKIFSHLLEEVKNSHPEIVRVELFTRQNNQKAIKLYQSLGFVVEGICRKRILDGNGKLDDDTMMSWINPNFQVNC